MINLIKSLIIICLGLLLGRYLYNYKNISTQNVAQNNKTQVLDTEFISRVKKTILKYKKPSRVEIEVFTKRYEKEIAEIKSMRIPMDKNSIYYMQLQLISDDGDKSSPLVMQIRFKDSKNNALITEESVNLN